MGQTLKSISGQAGWGQSNDGVVVRAQRRLIRYTEPLKKIPCRLGGAPMTATLLYRISAFVLVLLPLGIRSDS